MAANPRNPFALSAQVGASGLRFAWFLAANQMLEAQARKLGQKPTYVPVQPTPTRQDLLGALAQAVMADAEAVGRGLYPPAQPDPDGLIGSFERVRAMMADFPEALARRQASHAGSARAEPGADALPDYYVQDFHYQTGGYLSERSAHLYDTQVETLFYGSAQIMRRAALPGIAAGISGRDQRKLALLDVACGTGRLIREIRLAWPALQISGLDLSSTYIAEAQRHMAGLRSARFVEGNAETIPFGEASQDIVTSVFLFHELPPEVRRTVAREMARVLKPGGLLVFVDSLQRGDRPSWDGLLEAFPKRFHEPYFSSYAVDDLDDVFNAAGLLAQSQSLSFLSKVMVRRKVR